MKGSDLRRIDQLAASLSQSGERLLAGGAATTHSVVKHLVLVTDQRFILTNSSGDRVQISDPRAAVKVRKWWRQMPSGVSYLTLSCPSDRRLTLTFAHKWMRESEAIRAALP